MLDAFTYSSLWKTGTQQVQRTKWATHANQSFVLSIRMKQGETAVDTTQKASQKREHRLQKNNTTLYTNVHQLYAMVGQAREGPSTVELETTGGFVTKTTLEGFKCPDRQAMQRQAPQPWQH